MADETQDIPACCREVHFSVGPLFEFLTLGIQIFREGGQIKHLLIAQNHLTTGICHSLPSLLLCLVLFATLIKAW